MNIQELKRKWNKEKESYTKKEVGSGVQKFVKDVLKSPDVFTLREGLISTELLKRKNEFIEESATKAARQADIVIYINPDIVIPIEVERTGNIEAGFSQLMQYQLDLEKKYGILTDGNIWRFYNNAYLLKEYSFDQIFSELGIFKSFWQEYIKPIKYYLDFFEEKGQLKILPEDLSVENRRQDFFRDITTLIKSFQNKLNIEGYFPSLEIKERKKIATEITYAYIIQFILYKTLVDNAFDTFAADFQERENNIFESLKAEQYGKILGIIDGISIQISQNIYRPFKKEQEVINEKLQELFHRPKNELHDVSPWLDIFVFIKKYNFANVKNDIFGFIYENYLKELYQDTQKGQYFTDPVIVNFMLDQIGYNKETISKRLNNNPNEESISIIDPACGSGTFLYSATDRLIDAVPGGTMSASKKVEELVNENVFGLDIEEFPLYLAEMNILMRMLPLIINEKYNNPIDKKIKVFKTHDSVSEFINSGLKNTVNDIDVAGGQQKLFDASKLDLEYHSYMREEGDLKEMKESMGIIPRRRFDFVIGNPPYISYNECSKQKILFFELIKQGKAKLNDVYGVNLHSTPFKRKKYPPKPNFYAFFIALGLSLLKDNGKLCFIIPQTVLTETDYDVIRYHLAKYTTIEKIIIFPNALFVGRGLKQKNNVTTSSLIFVISKNTPSLINQAEIMIHKGLETEVEELFQNIKNKKKIDVKKIKQNDLLLNVGNWSFVKFPELLRDLFSFYNNNNLNISLYYENTESVLKLKSKFYFDVGYILNNKYITRDIGSKNFFSLIDYKHFNGYSNFTPTTFYPSDESKIKLPKNSQGYKTLKPKYKIIWPKLYSHKFFFTEQNVLPSMSHSQIISSENKEEILYLFSLLNSKLNVLIFDSLFQLNNEQYGSFLVISRIKEFIKVPKIGEDNQFVKDEIIKRTEEMLSLENVKLSDFVDFSDVMQQKFDGATVSSGQLGLLNKDQKIIFCKITGDRSLISQTIDRVFADKKLFLNKQISLQELKNLLVIDFEKQAKIKDYIDDLVFVLYFNIPIKKLGLNHVAEIKKLCQQNKFYKIVEES